MLLTMAATAVAQPRLVNGIAALANDGIITYHEVESHAKPAVDVLGITFFSKPEVFEQKRRETFNRALEDLVEKRLIMDDFKAQGGTIPDTIIEDQIKETIRKTYGDRATLTRSLKAEGRNYETLRQQVREDLVVNYMRSKNIAQAILVSPAKIELYYATNLTQFKVGEQIKLRMIVLTATPESSPEVARRTDEILGKLEEGVAFTEMASVYSEGSTGRQGGDWDWTDRTILNRGLADVGFALKVGQHSGVIGLTREAGEDYWAYLYDRSGRVTVARHYPAKGDMTEEKKFDPPANPQDLPVPPQVFYIMKIEDRRAAHTLTLDEVRDKIEQNLIALERARLQKRWIGRLKGKAFVRYF